MSLIDDLAIERDHNNEPTYDERDIRAHATEVIELATGGLLAVLIREELFVSFVVLEFSSSDLDGANRKFHRVFHGEGPSGALRELRHTYWGNAEAGYVFYPNAELISDAFAQLSKWFDCGAVPVHPDVERIAEYVQGDGTDVQRMALADGIRAGRRA